MPECHAGADLEGQGVGVHGVERSVEQSDLERGNLESGKDTVGHCGLEALLHCGDVLAGNVSSLDLVDELKSCDSLVGRSDLDDDVGELTTAAGLLLEYLTMLYGGADGLFVVDLRRTLVDLHAELAFQTVYDDLQVELTHTADDGLSCLMVGAHGECGVLFGELAEGDAELVEVLLGLGLHGQSDHRIGEGHGLQDDGMVLVADGITCTQLLEAYCGTDVAGLYEVDGILLVGVHLVQTGHTLFLAGAGVEHVSTGIQSS